MTQPLNSVDSHLSNHGVHSLPGRRGADTEDSQQAHGTLGGTEVGAGQCSPLLALRAAYNKWTCNDQNTE